MSFRNYLFDFVYWCVVIALFVYVLSESQLSEEQNVQRRQFGLTTYRYLKENCVIRDECKEYPAILIKCSTAGDIDRCIEINMPFGWESCDTNGEVKSTIWRFGSQFPSKYVPPTGTQCLLNRGSRFFERLTE